MRRVLASLILLPLAACGPTNADFDLRLREMAGSNERNLLGSMGRIPDNTYQLDGETKVLQWRWDTSYISPGMAPLYTRVGRGDLDADGRVSADPCPRGLHRGVDREQRRHPELSLARQRLPDRHAREHAAALTS